MAGGATTVPEDGATTTKFRPVVERRRSPRAARAAQVAGVIGVIVCLILALVVWLGRGAVHGALDDLATTVDGGFDRAVTAVQSVSDQIDAAGTQVGSIADGRGRDRREGRLDGRDQPPDDPPGELRRLLPDDPHPLRRGPREPHGVRSPRSSASPGSSPANGCPTAPATG